MNYDIKELVREEIHRKALSELSSHNKDIFIRVLNQFLQNPNSKAIRNCFVDNLNTGIQSILSLRKSTLIPSNEELLDLNEVLNSLGEFLDHRGYEGELETKIRRTFLLLHDYLKNLPPPAAVLEHSVSEGYGSKRDEHLCIVGFEKWNPSKSQCVPVQQETLLNMDYQYLKHYFKYLDENVKRIKEGLNAKSKATDWNINLSTDLGEVQNLALQDSMKHLHSGIDFSSTRKELNSFLGNMSREELSHKKLLDGATKLLDDITEKRTKIIQSLEGYETTELTEDTWLNKAIRKRMRERR